MPRALQAIMWTWRFTEFSRRAHARFGDTFTVRLGGLPTAVVTKDRDAIRRLFSGDPLNKRHGNDPLRPLLGEHAVGVLEPQQHLARRKLLLPPLHGERVKSYAKIIERLVVAELDHLKPGDVVPLEPVAQTLTLAVMLEGVLGMSDIAMGGRLQEIFDAMDTRLTNIGAYVPQLGHRARWNVLAQHYFWRLKDELDALLLEHLATTHADARLAEREDLLAMLVLANDEDGASLTDEQLRDELVGLIVGGQTAATTVAWAVELLVHHPTVMARAREGDDAYLEAIVKEVLRIRPPIPLSASRHVLEPFPIGEWTIPSDVTILVNSYGVHHDPDAYPQPEAFRPERFLSQSPNSYAFLPFGGGAHRCPGAALGLLETNIMLRLILTRLDLEPTSRGPASPARRAISLTPRRGARVRVAGVRGVPERAGVTPTTA
jgi:cytochrome P450 family 135